MRTPEHLFFARIYHTGFYADGRVNRISVQIQDLDSGYAYQDRKSPKYVPVGGYIDSPLTTNTLYSVTQGEVSRFIEVGVLRAELFLCLRKHDDKGGPAEAGASLSLTINNAERSSGVLKLVVNTIDARGFLAGELVTISGLTGAFRSLNGDHNISSVTKAENLTGSSGTHTRIEFLIPGTDIPAAILAGVLLEVPNGACRVRLSASSDPTVAYFEGDIQVAGVLDPTGVKLTPNDGSSLPNNTIFLNTGGDVYLKDGSGILVPIGGSTAIFGDYIGGNYAEFESDGTLVFYGDATVWDDMRISATTTTSGGSNPPVFGQVANDGNNTPVGSAIEFSGAESSQIPSAAGLNFNGARWSIGFWFRPKATYSNGMRILHKSSWALSLTNGFLRVRLNNQQFLADNAVNVGADNCVVVTVDGTSSAAIVYLDGAVAGTRTFGGAFSDVAAAIFVGSLNNASNYADMVIDEIRFWNKELNPAEVAAFYNNGLGTEGPVAAANLVAGYHLNEGVGNTSADYSGGLTMTFDVNAPAWASGILSTTAASRGVYTYVFGPGQNQEVFFIAQVPHKYVEGTDLRPHVHWFPTSNAIGTVKWGLEYSWFNYGGTVPLTSDISASEAINAQNYEHLITSLPNLTGTGMEISSMLMCRLYREGSTDTYPDAVALLEFDFHYQIDTLGSREPFIK